MSSSSRTTRPGCTSARAARRSTRSGRCSKSTACAQRSASREGATSTPPAASSPRRRKGMAIHHDVRGDGPAVLLVHAGIADSRMWAPLAERLLAAGFRVVTCDLRGHGRTPLEPGVVSNAADLLGLLDALGIARAAVVGASFGGRVALELALRAPERVAALALLGAALDEFDASPELEAFDAEEEAAIEAGDLDAAVAAVVRTWVTRDGRDADPA